MNFLQKKTFDDVDSDGTFDEWQFNAGLLQKDAEIDDHLPENEDSKFVVFKKQNFWWCFGCLIFLVISIFISCMLDYLKTC